MITRNTIADQITGAAKDFLRSAILGDDFPSENILHQYRTFNYRVTLGIVSNQEMKTQSYKKTGFDYVVFSSHGKNTDGTTPGGNATLNKIQSVVNMISGANKNIYDFYLEDLYIKSFMSGARDWSTDLKMKIVEPYSIDTFLSTIINGLTLKGYYNFDKSNNFILKIDFVGYKDNSDEPSVIPFSTRYYPLCITSMNASLSQAGTVYDIVATPMSETARYDDVNMVPQTITLTGNTVRDIMQSLETSLNEVAIENQKTTKLATNRYKIIFIDYDGKEVADGSECVTAEIANEKMFDSIREVGPANFSSNTKLYTESSTTADVNGQEVVQLRLSVNGKEGLLNIIDNIITDSHFVIDKIPNSFATAMDADGQVKWWRVIPDIENGEFNKATNSYAKIITYKIAPRKVHYTKVTSLFLPATAVAASDYESMTARKYEWNYTGNNRDILSFNLNFNQLWTKIITGNFGKSPVKEGENKSVKTDDKVSAGVSKNQPTATPNALVGVQTTVSLSSDAPPSTNQVRGNGETNPLFALARDINSLINNPYEQIEFNMEILGDPMWLGTQFIDKGANTKTGGSSQLFTVDGGFALRTVDPMVRVIAYAPRDFNAEGFLANNKGELRDMSKYSAYYTVREVESYFQNGVFKQKIKGNRMSNQDLSGIAAGDRITANKIDLSIR